MPVVLGLFALPELCDLAVARSSIASDVRFDARGGMWQGAKDCFTNWWLVLRCSWIGAAFGAVPGIGGAVIDWLAYGHAVRTEKGAAQSFGKGDVRGVIAAESANNAREGGALVPTVAFGVPGSAGMANRPAPRSARATRIVFTPMARLIAVLIGLIAPGFATRRPCGGTGRS